MNQAIGIFFIGHGVDGGDKARPAFLPKPDDIVAGIQGFVQYPVFNAVNPCFQKLADVLLVENVGRGHQAVFISFPDNLPH